MEAVEVFLTRLDLFFIMIADLEFKCKTGEKYYLHRTACDWRKLYENL